MQHALINDLNLIREKNPLIHNVTNLVTMDFIANGLLALGASPVMAHGQLEIAEMVAISSSITINIGTLDEYWNSCFKEAVINAKNLGKPVVLDPVGAGATTYRTKTCHELLALGGISVVKGNASEIMAIAGENYQTKGVDSQAESVQAINAASKIAHTYNTCVVISGKEDVVVNASEHQIFAFGHPLMSKVTGMGCLLTSVIAAFHAVNANRFNCASHAVTFFGIVGEIAASQETVKGPASFKTAFIDCLHQINTNQISKRLGL